MCAYEGKHLLDLIEIPRLEVHDETFLEVPHLEVHDETEGNFRNLMALEQCHYPFEAYICNCMVLLDFLINTREDVELLVKKGLLLTSYVAIKQLPLWLTNLALK